MASFKDYWKAQAQETVEKADALTVTELAEVNEVIDTMQDKGKIAKDIIAALQQQFPKLQERYRAEMAYYTEVKRKDTEDVVATADDLGVTKYRIVLSPHCCDKCRLISKDGKRIFTDEDVKKGGYNDVPPFHPNCYCILLPVS